MINIEELYNKVDGIAEIMFKFRMPANGSWKLDYCVLKEDGFHLSMYNTITRMDDTILIPDKYYNMELKLIEIIEDDLAKKRLADEAERQATILLQEKEEWEQMQRQLYETLKKKFENK